MELSAAEVRLSAGEGRSVSSRVLRLSIYIDIVVNSLNSKHAELFDFITDLMDILESESCKLHYDNNSNNKNNKVITTMVIGPLDKHTYCVRSAFTQLGLW